MKDLKSQLASVLNVSPEPKAEKSFDEISVDAMKSSTVKGLWNMVLGYSKQEIYDYREFHRGVEIVPNKVALDTTNEIKVLEMDAEDYYNRLEMGMSNSSSPLFSGKKVFVNISDFVSAIRRIADMPNIEKFSIQYLARNASIKLNASLNVKLV